MPVYYHVEEVKFRLHDKRAVSNWINKVIEAEGGELGTVNYIFTSDERLLGINNQYLKHNHYTDIITFDYSGEGEISGDIYISIDRVRDNAGKMQIAIGLELARVMIHGILHLLGYQDKQQRDMKIMRGKEDDYLATVPRETFGHNF